MDFEPWFEKNKIMYVVEIPVQAGVVTGRCDVVTNFYRVLCVQNLIQRVLKKIACAVFSVMLLSRECFVRLDLNPTASRFQRFKFEFIYTNMPQNIFVKT